MGYIINRQSALLEKLDNLSTVKCFNVLQKDVKGKTNVIILKISKL